MVKNVPLHVYEHVWKLLEAKTTVWVMGDTAQMQNEEGGVVYARDRATHPGFIYNAIVYLPYHLKRSALYGAVSVMSIMGLAFAYWSLKGRSDKRRKHLAGSQLVSVQELIRQLKRSHKASDIVLGDLPLVKDSETQHMLITGTTGSGKTNCFHTLLPQVRAKQQRAVIVDTTGEFVDRYYRHGKDLLLNPLDERSVPWHPWAECTESYHYDELAVNLIPLSGHDPFWVNSARTVLTETLKVYADKGINDIHRALRSLTIGSLKDLHLLIQDTKASPLVDPASEKTALSIRQWIQSKDLTDDRWLFLSMNSEQRDALMHTIHQVVADVEALKAKQASDASKQ